MSISVKQNHHSPSYPQIQTIKIRHHVHANEAAQALRPINEIKISSHKIFVLLQLTISVYNNVIVMIIQQDIFIPCFRVWLFVFTVACHTFGHCKS